jgi:hypothetical protein
MVRYNACALGITNNLALISIGVEDVDDLIADFANALGRFSLGRRGREPGSSEWCFGKT